MDIKLPYTCDTMCCVYYSVMRVRSKVTQVRTHFKHRRHSRLWLNICRGRTLTTQSLLVK